MFKLSFNKIITENQSGQRIDNFLLKELKGVPKSHIYRILRTGQIRVNKKRVKPDYRLKANDQVRIPPIRTATKSTNKKPSTKTTTPQNLHRKPGSHTTFNSILT